MLGPGATCLVLGVGGDTLLSIASLAERKQTLRPMALDLLWQVPVPPASSLILLHWQRASAASVAALSLVGHCVYEPVFRM